MVYNSFLTSCGALIWLGNLIPLWLNHSVPSTAEQQGSELLNRRCPLCGGGEYKVILSKCGLRVVRCLGCSMVYANPAPVPMASGDYYDNSATGYYLSEAKLRSDYADVRFDRELRLFRRHCPSGAVLDVGCSSGGFLNQLKKRFPGDYEVLGTDVSGSALDYANSQGIPVTRGNFLELDFGPRQFEAITFWAVLEHLADPGAFLERAVGLLRTGGRCFVLVPNLRSLAARCLGEKYRYIYPQHLNYFEPATLARLVGKRFRTLETRFMHFNPVVIWQDWRSGGREVSNEERGLLLARTTRYKQSAFLGPVRAFYRCAESALAAFGLADNLVVVLEKPGPERI